VYGTEATSRSGDVNKHGGGVNGIWTGSDVTFEIKIAEKLASGGHVMSTMAYDLVMADCGA